jgi:hypothetical protein
MVTRAGLPVSIRVTPPEEAKTLVCANTTGPRTSSTQRTATRLSRERSQSAGSRSEGEKQAAPLEPAALRLDASRLVPILDGLAGALIDLFNGTGGVLSGQLGVSRLAPLGRGRHLTGNGTPVELPRPVLTPRV